MPSYPQPGEITICEINRQFSTDSLLSYDPIRLSLCGIGVVFYDDLILNVIVWECSYNTRITLTISIEICGNRLIVSPFLFSVVSANEFSDVQSKDAYGEILVS